MSLAQIMDRPKRWDLPFSRDFPDPAQGRDMAESEIDSLLSTPPFRAMDPERFPRGTPLREILRNDTRVRGYANGDVIVRQGDYGDSAFLILEGRVRVILEGLDPVAIGRRERQKKSPLQSLLDLFRNPAASEVRDASRYPQMHSDRAADDAPGHPVAVQDLTNVLTVFPQVFERTVNNPMKKGQLFGELAALGRIPRSATVVADGEAELLEIRWQGLRELRKFDDALREQVDAQYREYGLSATLRSSPLLAGLAKEALEKISGNAEFETYGKFDWYGTYKQLREKTGGDPLADEPEIAVEGHYPNGLILIRAGFARLSRRYGNGERTISYLGKGEVYGLAELAHNARGGEQVPLATTLRAVGYVDIVRISTREFEELILPAIPAERIPPLSGAVQSLERAAAPAPAAPPRGSEAIDPAMLEFLVENRFINGTKTMMIDLDRCTRCDDCVRACSTGHGNNPRFVRHGRTFGHWMVANACMHCADPVCMIGCPTGAIHRTAEGGQVVINDITCIGCGTCAASCPYDNIRMVEVRDQDAAMMIDPQRGLPIVKATKCDLCVDHEGGPACARACPHDALVRVDMRDMDFLGRWLNR